MGDGLLRVVFPEVAGTPMEFEQIKTISLNVLPGHLDMEFYFRYLTWESFQLTVPPME